MRDYPVSLQLQIKSCDNKVWKTLEGWTNMRYQSLLIRREDRWSIKTVKTVKTVTRKPKWPWWWSHSIALAGHHRTHYVFSRPPRRRDTTTTVRLPQTSSERRSWAPPRWESRLLEWYHAQRTPVRGATLLERFTAPRLNEVLPSICNMYGVGRQLSDIAHELAGGKNRGGAPVPGSKWWESTRGKLG